MRHSNVSAIQWIDSYFILRHSDLSELCGTHASCRWFDEWFLASLVLDRFRRNLVAHRGKLLNLWEKAIHPDIGFVECRTATHVHHHCCSHVCRHVHTRWFDQSRHPCNRYRGRSLDLLVSISLHMGLGQFCTNPSIYAKIAHKPLQMAGVWMYSTEIQTISYRSFGAALGAATQWLFNYVILQVAPIGIDNIGWKMYFVFACFNAAFVPFIYFFVPEVSNNSSQALFSLRGQDADHSHLHRRRALPSRVLISALRPV